MSKSPKTIRNILDMSPDLLEVKDFDFREISIPEIFLEGVVESLPKELFHPAEGLIVISISSRVQSFPYLFEEEGEFYSIKTTRARRIQFHLIGDGRFCFSFEPVDWGWENQPKKVMTLCGSSEDPTRRINSLLMFKHFRKKIVKKLLSEVEKLEKDHDEAYDKVMAAFKPFLPSSSANILKKL